MLIIDYGYATAAGHAPDTLQAVHRGERVSPYLEPGRHDLTAHVDFGALAGVARARGLVAHGPVAQGAFLGALGIAARADALKQGRDHAAAASITAALLRLTAPQQMGAIFQVLALTADGWPAPAGFAMEPA